jgi:hypothetical protein
MGYSGQAKAMKARVVWANAKAFFGFRVRTKFVKALKKSQNIGNKKTAPFFFSFPFPV